MSDKNDAYFRGWNAALASLAATQAPGVDAPSQHHDFAADPTRAKRLLVKLWDKFPETRPMIEGHTGSWFAWGTDRNEVGESPAPAVQRQMLPDERWEAECERDYGPYPGGDADLPTRLRWWVPKSARHGKCAVEHDLLDAADEIAAKSAAVHPEPSQVAVIAALRELVAAQDAHKQACRDWSAKQRPVGQFGAYEFALPTTDGLGLKAGDMPEIDAAVARLTKAWETARAALSGAPAAGESSHRAERAQPEPAIKPRIDGDAPSYSANAVRRMIDGLEKSARQFGLLVTTDHNGSIGLAAQPERPTAPLSDAQIERAWLETTDHHIIGKLAAFAFAEKLLSLLAAPDAPLEQPK